MTDLPQTRNTVDGRDQQTEQLTSRIGVYADRAGERADRLAEALDEALECIIFGNGQPTRPEDLQRWRTVLAEEKQ